MKRHIGTVLLTAFFAAAAGAQDMWLESSSFATYAGRNVTIRIGSGLIFGESKSALEPAHVDVLLGLGPDGRPFEPPHPYVSGRWLNLDFQPQDYGNYWIGLASLPGKVAFSGEDFNRYLQAQGNQGLLSEREERGILNRSEVEQRSRFAKIYIQSGKTRSRTYRRPLGLKIEIVLLKNPYKLHAGDALPLRVLFNGEPLEGVHLAAGSDDRSGAVYRVVTGGGGKATIRLATSGRWYVSGHHLLQVDKRTHSYESYRITVTFELAGG